MVCCQTSAPRANATAAVATATYGSKRLPTQSRLAAVEDTKSAAPKAAPAATTATATPTARTGTPESGADALATALAAQSAQERSDALSHSVFRSVDQYLLRTILELLNFSDLKSVKRTCRYFASVLHKSQIVARRSLICFHSKVGFDSADTGNGSTGEVFGIGITPMYYPGGDRKRLNTIRACLDVLSLSAFESGVRYGVWKQEL